MVVKIAAKLLFTTTKRLIIFDMKLYMPAGGSYDLLDFKMLFIKYVRE